MQVLCDLKRNIILKMCENAIPSGMQKEEGRRRQGVGGRSFHESEIHPFLTS